MGDVPEDAVGRLHDRWRRGDRDDRAWFEVLRGPMTRAASAAIRRMTGHRPDARDVDEAVFTAFKEFLELDSEAISEPVGLAATISYRRGQDAGRRHNRNREFPNTDEVMAESDDRTALDPEAEVLEAERAAEREHVYQLAMECIGDLPQGQAEVVKATILEERDLSDWAHENGKSYQAAHKQRTKALEALRVCVKSKQDERGKGGDDVA
jgi:DNA-directed RNA polymerase specialized sigma24 family protein